MPCYVKFHTREYLSQLPGMRDNGSYLRDDHVRDQINDEMMELYLDSQYHLVDCEPFSNHFMLAGYHWYSRWVAEWSLDGVHPIQEVQEIQTPYLDNLSASVEPIATKKPKRTKAPSVEETRTIILKSVPSLKVSCDLCFYKEHKGCFEKECRIRYWILKR